MTTTAAPPSVTALAPRPVKKTPIWAKVLLAAGMTDVEEERADGLTLAIGDFELFTLPYTRIVEAIDPTITLEFEFTQ